MFDDVSKFRERIKAAQVLLISDRFVFISSDVVYLWDDVEF